MAAKQYETLELEEQQEPLAVAPEARGRGLQFRGKALLAAGALLLGAAGLALALSPAPAARAPAPATALAETIQGYALGQVGRPLTGEELAAVQASVAAKLQRVRAQALPAGVRPRWLEDSDSEAAVCMQDMKEYFKKLLGKAMAYGIQTLIICSTGKGDACSEAQHKLDNMDEEEKDACRKTGELCAMTVTTPGGAVHEQEELCIPKSCHEQLEVATHFLTHDVQDLMEGKDLGGEIGDHDHDGHDHGDEDCEGCTANVHCGEE